VGKPKTKKNVSQQDDTAAKADASSKDRPLYASVDLGGTNIAAALATKEGEIVAQDSRPTKSHKGPEAVIRRMGELVNDLAKTVEAKPRALGVGVPGLIDLKSGTTKFLPNLPTHWRDVPVAELLSAKVGCPVYLLNDVRMATLGEMTFGHGKSCRSMVFFALGTGVGGGVVIDGTLRLGPYGAAGELGHMNILPDGPACGCGSCGCLETLCSGPAIAAEGVRLMLSGQAGQLYDITNGEPSQVSPKTMAQAAELGDAAVAGVIERAARYLGIGAANIISAVHPELIVVGGGVAAMGERLLQPLRDEIHKRVRMFPVDDLRVERSLLKDQAGTLGGIALAMQGGELTS
jgi:glucokinase